MGTAMGIPTGATGIPLRARTRGSTIADVSGSMLHANARSRDCNHRHPCRGRSWVSKPSKSCTNELHPLEHDP